MAEKLLIGLVGFPRSGKSTIAKKLWKYYGAPIVAPDALRIALYGDPWHKEGEPMIWATAYYMVQALFGAGHGVVILDSCAVTRGERAQWNLPGIRTAFYHVDTEKEVCIVRASSTLQPYLAPGRLTVGLFCFSTPPCYRLLPVLRSGQQSVLFSNPQTLVWPGSPL